MWLFSVEKPNTFDYRSPSKTPWPAWLCSHLRPSAGSTHRKWGAGVHTLRLLSTRLALASWRSRSRKHEPVTLATLHQQLAYTRQRVSTKNCGTHLAWITVGSNEVRIRSQPHKSELLPALTDISQIFTQNLRGINNRWPYNSPCGMISRRPPPHLHMFPLLKTKLKLGACLF